MNSPIPLNSFIQIQIVIDDMDKALESWCNLFNLPRPEVMISEARPDENLEYRGETACYGQKFAVLECRERGFVVELIEPDENPSTFREFLDKHGCGVHHIGFEVGEARDDIVSEMEELGYALRTFGVYPGSSWTIMDTEEDLGVNLNIKPRA